MGSRSIAKFFFVSAASLALVFALTSVKAPRVTAADDDTNSKIKIGFEIAPVPLNLKGRNKAMVGLGSYIVNAQADCNGCHTSGGPPNFNYAAGFNPYFDLPPS